MINVTDIKAVIMDTVLLDKHKDSIIHYSSDIFTNELVYFISGERITTFNGAVTRDLPDTVRLLPKGRIEGDYSIELLSDCKCIYIWFEAKRPVSDTIMSLKNMNKLKPLFVKIYNAWNSKAPGYYTKTMSLLYEIINAVKCHTSSYLSSESTRKLQPALDYMRESYLDPEFSLQEMCKRSGLSYDYFKELFIKIHGEPPVKYVTTLRMEKAKELILTGRYTVSDIAGMCGFDNVYYFSSVFKKSVGVSPKKYKA